MTSFITRFGGDATGAGTPEQLGAKGANLCAMASLGLPVPPGFVLGREAFAQWRRDPDPVIAEIHDALRWLECATERNFGGDKRPLLVAVRSGAMESMPGMLDTILNVGLTQSAIAALSEEASPRFAQDCRRRLLPALAAPAFGLDAEELEEAADDWLFERGYDGPSGLNAEELAGLNAEVARVIAEEGEDFPEDAHLQLTLAVDAVFQSWFSRRARAWRTMHGIGEEGGTAVVVQAMVFGNRRTASATGVAFTRDPNSGDPRISGEYLPNAQGEEVVAGLRTPMPLTEADRAKLGSHSDPMEATLPEAFAALETAAATLERHFADAQEIEFTIEEGRFWLLQTRRAKRSSQAAMRIAVEMVEAGVITRDDALLRFRPTDIDRMLHPMVDPSAPRDVIARGLPASPGAVTGEAVFSPDEAEAAAADGRVAILVRAETSPEDIRGMYAAAGVLTARGGMTSHAAVVARGLGKPCVCGAGGASVDSKAGILTAQDGRIVRRGEILTIDGAAGEALFGAAVMVPPAQDDAFATVLAWADARRRMAVRANADAAEDAAIARRLGAEGIGLCRTEHAFFQPGRLTGLRRLILAEDPAERLAALSELLPMQRADFEALFAEMAGYPITIRLLDPPLHEFLPRTDDDFALLSEALDVSVAELRDRANALREHNPMLGRRGCRVGIAFPEIYDMQLRAIFEAASAVEAESDAVVDLEISVPFVSTSREVKLMRARAEAVAATVQHRSGLKPTYRLGVMIETPRSALCAGTLAEDVAFFSLGTNDLTQMVYGLSRDDAGRFITDYVAKGAIRRDPFHRIDDLGVGELLHIAVDRGKTARPDLTIGMCGEHGGDPASIRFCEELGIDYVSCSPYRTPAARIAAAQATILRERGG